MKAKKFTIRLEDGREFEFKDVEVAFFPGFVLVKHADGLHVGFASHTVSEIRYRE